MTWKYKALALAAGLAAASALSACGRNNMTAQPPATSAPAAPATSTPGTMGGAAETSAPATSSPSAATSSPSSPGG
jgi:hypothetical protein